MFIKDRLLQISNHHQFFSAILLINDFILKFFGQGLDFFSAAYLKMAGRGAAPALCCQHTRPGTTGHFAVGTVVPSILPPWTCPWLHSHLFHLARKQRPNYYKLGGLTQPRDGFKPHGNLCGRRHPDVPRP